MKKIGVLAGTLTDTKLGLDLLNSHNFKAYGYPISNNCFEQDKLQFLSREELEKIASDKISDMKNKNLDSCLVYCNSLSSAVDFNKISKKLNFKIITPYDAYSILGKKFDFLYLLAANSISTKNIEEFIKSSNNNIRFISVGYLGLVNEIEKNTDKNQIIENTGLNNLFNFFNSIEKETLSKAIVLSCTHFPYVKKELQLLTDIAILDPMDYLFDLL